MSGPRRREAVIKGQSGNKTPWLESKFKKFSVINFKLINSKPLLMELQIGIVTESDDRDRGIPVL